MNIVIFILGVSNLLLLLLVFTFMARPHFFVPLLRRWMQNESLSEESIFLLCHRLRWGGVMLLFCWSFCCSALIGYAKLFLTGAA